MFKIFDEIGFNIGDVIAVCEYNGDIVAVKCDNEMSGIYPDYNTAQPIIIGWLYSFKLFNKLGHRSYMDAIIFEKTKDKEGKEYVEIYFAEDSHDGFQPISEDFLFKD